jgi:AraC family transcriptional regulator
MHKVIAYIDQYLDAPLDLNALAEVAHFSPFHFHRLFSAWMGETLGDYLRRRRAETAAMRIASQPRVTVLNIALSVGFSSAEAFSRAFKSRFGLSPTAWRAQQVALRRANSNPDQMDSKRSQVSTTSSSQHEISQPQNVETIMNVKLIERQPVTVAYLRHLGPYGEPLSLFWQGTYYPWAVANNLLDKPRYGISHDDPSITAPEQCRYDAGVEVPADFVPNGGAFKTTLPGGRYAALRFYGTSDKVGEAWTALLRDWLPSSGLQLDARPCFEYYPCDGRYDSKTGAFECDVCIPVIPL